MPRLLDLFCCEGGASEGYRRAGFEVYGLDLFVDYNRKRYPFASYKGDALDALWRLLRGETLPFQHKDGRVDWLHLDDFVAVAGSPPCQHASAGTRAQDRDKYPRLIEPTRELLDKTGLPYVIENVKGADLIDPILLCGRMFGLSAVDTDGIELVLDRHRLFESNVDLIAPPHPTHGDEWVGGSYGGARRDKYEARYVRKGGYVPSKPVQEALLGIDWMTQKGLFQSIPPAYTEYLGRQLLKEIE